MSSAYRSRASWRRFYTTCPTRGHRNSKVSGLLLAPCLSAHADPQLTRSACGSPHGLATIPKRCHSECTPGKPDYTLHPNRAHHLGCSSASASLRKQPWGDTLISSPHTPHLRSVQRYVRRSARVVSPTDTSLLQALREMLPEAYSAQAASPMCGSTADHMAQFRDTWLGGLDPDRMSEVRWA